MWDTKTIKRQNNKHSVQLLMCHQLDKAYGIIGA